MEIGNYGIQMDVANMFGLGLLIAIIRATKWLNLNNPRCFNPRIPELQKFSYEVDYSGLM